MSEEMHISAKRERIINQKSEVTGRISDTCRVIGFGLLVAYFTITFNDSVEAINISSFHAISLKIMGIFGILTVFFDYLQYVFGYISSKDALKNPDSLYDDGSVSYKSRIIFFYLKQLMAGLGSLVLIYIIALPSGLLGQP